MNQVAEHAFALLHQHLTAATCDLFRSYGIPLRHTDSGEAPAVIEEQSVMAVIGFAGEQARGALMLVSSRPAVDSWMRASGDPCEGVDACDTLGEFSNMLLGRLKGRLLPEGFPILLATPTTASGSSLRLPPPPCRSVLLGFDGPAWRLTVRVDATFDEGFTLQADELRSRAADAGEMMFF